MRLSDFDYHLPPELIAQEPAPERDASRLLVLERAGGALHHRRFSDLPEYLRPGDVLVINETKVIPARLFGRLEDGRSVELLLVRPVSLRPLSPVAPPEAGAVRDAAADECWEALAKPARPVREGRTVTVADGRLSLTVAARGRYGRRVLRLPAGADLPAVLETHGAVPLPPYIRRAAADREPDGGQGRRDRDRYQTVYAKEAGAVAAPTAGLHFTPALLDRIRAMGVSIRPLTLHVGPGTFQPVRVEEIAHHRMEAEPYTIPADTAQAVRAAHREGRRVVVVGTTCVRALEYAADSHDVVRAGSSEADLFIRPGHRFQVVDALVTNFHLPRSTLLMLVTAFAGLETIRRAYDEAVARGYRFYSYGDAMLIL